ncbi:MAG: hypothetical protein ACREMV_06810 [Gemmatimonadales bacterium]
MTRRQASIAVLVGAALCTAACADGTSASRSTWSLELAPDDPEAQGVARGRVLGLPPGGAVVVDSGSGFPPPDTIGDSTAADPLPPDTSGSDSTIVDPPPPPPDSSVSDTIGPPPPPPPDSSVTDTGVVDPPGSEPVAGAEVRVYHLVLDPETPNDSVPKLRHLVGIVLTDTDGRFELTRIPQGEYNLDVVPPAASPYQDVRFWAMTSPGSGVIDVRILLPRK